MKKKYKILKDDHKDVLEILPRRIFTTTVYRIVALRSFADVHRGDLGGYIEKENNLSQTGSCWVYDNACVFEEATVFGSAIIRDFAEVFEAAGIHDRATVYGHAEVFGFANLSDDCRVFDYASVFGQCYIAERALVYEDAHVFEEATVWGDAIVRGISRIYGKAEVSGSAAVVNSNIHGTANISSGIWKDADEEGKNMDFDEYEDEIIE